MNRENELIKNTFILAIGQLLPKMMSIFLLPLMTVNLSVDEYGIYDLIVSLGGLIVPLITMQLQQAIFRFLLTEKEYTCKSAYFTSALFFLGAVSIMICPVFVVCGYIKKQIYLYAGIFLLFVFEAFYYLIGQVVRSYGNNKKFSFAAILFSVINLLLVYINFKYLKFGLNGVVISQAVAYLGATFYLLFDRTVISLIRIKNVSISKLKILLRFSVPIVPSAISLWVVNLSSRVIISAILGVGANGVYAVANKLPSMFSMAYNIFNMSWTETASRSFEDDDKSVYYSKMFESLYKFLIGVMLVMVTIMPLIFDVIIDDKYYEAFNIIPILYFSVFFNCMVSFLGSLYIAAKETKTVGFSSIFGAVINIVIILVLINKMELYAAAIGAACSFFAVTVYRMFDIKRYIKITYNFNTLLSGMFFFVVSVWICSFDNLLSSIICACIAVYFNLVENRNFILRFLKKMKVR